MQLLTMALPFLTSAVMFGFKKLAGMKLFDNGAEATPWLRVVLIIMSFAGTGAVAILNGAELNPDSVSTDLQMILAALGNAYLSHLFYKGVTAAQ